MDTISKSEKEQKPVTLQECKDKIAHKYGYKDWKDSRWDGSGTLEEAAELYASSLRQENQQLRELLDEAKLQIEYLHKKFSETGTGNSVISRIAALQNTKGK